VIWRDIKVYDDHAFIVSEASNHGMQIFDLTRLGTLDRAAAPVTVTADARYTGFGRAHNLNINEETGYAYAVGTRQGIECSQGMHVMDISTPTAPVFVGCVSEDGYIHDTQCVVYRGADARYLGREICFAASPTPGPSPHSVLIVDVTDKANPVIISNTPYEGAGYSHQGWLTPDQETFIFGDEGDEGAFGHNTRTLVFDVRNLESPAHIGTHFGPARAINHNIYTENRWIYQSNYTAGLRILDGRDAAAGELEEVAYFDVYPPHDDAVFGFGTWSNYAWFSSGVIAVHGYQGLWIVKARLGQQK
jgi:choice-of-anchor B domain-containing protein